jgi:TPR repeat protein
MSQDDSNYVKIDVGNCHDEESVKSYYLRAYKSNSRDFEHIAEIYTNDTNTHIKWLEAAANEGISDAMYRLYFHYKNNNTKLSLKWLAKAFKHNNEDAIYHISNNYSSNELFSENDRLQEENDILLQQNKTYKRLQVLDIGSIVYYEIIKYI